MTYRKKLIEVALPLEAINVASAREKSIRHGHPSTLHLWWARRPLAAARAVIFSSLVDDPDDPGALPAFVEACRHLDGKELGYENRNVAATGDTPRMRLFDFIEKLVQWESTTDETILNKARELILIATEGNPPPLLDPFAGGGSIPLEAQRLGLEAHASDLNPVAVMINKAQIEIPPRFANQPPVNPRDRAKMFGGGNDNVRGDNANEGVRATDHAAASADDNVGATRRVAPTDSPTNTLWKGAAGLAADVRYYGEWMRDRAWERIGHLYPTYNGETVIAWLWARTVKCPNPACGAQMPLVTSFDLSQKTGRRAWIEPIIDYGSRTVRFEVKHGEGKIPESTKAGRGSKFRCLVCGETAQDQYMKDEGLAKRIGTQLMAIVTEGARGRSFFSPTREQESLASKAQPSWHPTGEIVNDRRWFSPPIYGYMDFSDLFTPRQLIALTTLSDLVSEAREQVYADALVTGMSDGGVHLRDGGRGAHAYSEAVSVYLALGVSRGTDINNALCRWEISKTQVRNLFGRQAIPMIWDFAENNVFNNAAGDYMTSLESIIRVIERSLGQGNEGWVFQMDAARLTATDGTVLSTDPPYYDNIGYADLSDFFYVWMRRMLRDIYPDIFGTMLVPKEPELIASPHRHGSREAANEHFESGLQHTFANIRRFISANYPLTVYYAFKQQDAESSDEDDEGSDSQLSSTGWETMLASVIHSGFSLDGTWPMRTELSNRMVGSGTNALASSIVLVCRPRLDDAPTISRRQFVDALRRELPAALKDMQSGNIAPVDLAQASIGPGMAIYSRYSKVLEADGSALSVRAALGIINQELDAYLAEQDGDIDADTRFAVAWFTQFGFEDGDFGQADVLARAKNTSVAGVEAASVVRSSRGKVRLLHWSEYDPGAWDPREDRRPTVWEATHHLIERLNSHGEDGAAALLLRMPPDMAAEARSLAYRLYSICERKGWADHARDYNALVISWTEVGEVAVRKRDEQQRGDATEQLDLF